MSRISVRDAIAATNTSMTAKQLATIVSEAGTVIDSDEWAAIKAVQADLAAGRRTTDVSGRTIIDSFMAAHTEADSRGDHIVARAAETAATVLVSLVGYSCISWAPPAIEFDLGVSIAGGVVGGLYGAFED